MRTKHYTGAFEVKAIGDDGSFEGYCSVFNNVDSYRDIVMPGAFSDSLMSHKSSGTMPALLWQHRADQPIGVWQDMEQDSHGLKGMGQLCLDTYRGKEARALMKMKAVRGLSIGFSIPDGGESYDRDNRVNKLHKIDLWETSIVTFPANTAATVDNVRSDWLRERSSAVIEDALKSKRNLEQFLRDSGLPKAVAVQLASAYVPEVRSDSDPDIVGNLAQLVERLRSAA